MASAMGVSVGVPHSSFIDRLWVQRQHTATIGNRVKSFKFKGVGHFELRVNSELVGSSKTSGRTTVGPVGLGGWALPERNLVPKRGDRCRTISIDKANAALVSQPSTTTLAEAGAAFAQEKVARVMEEIAYYKIVLPRKVERMKDILSRELIDDEVPFSMKVYRFQEAFWKFLRPHTIRGTLIGATAVGFRALLENTELVSLALVPKALYGMLALLCGNGYIVGINQIYDVQSDRINKPFLPIAAGELSIRTAWALVSAFAALGVGLVATNFGPAITGLYTMGLFLGGIYSVPPLSLKRFPVPAFLIIATVRGFLLNFGVYHATVAALGLPFKVSPAIMFIAAFVTVFAIVISITKDLADVEGDRRRFGPRTFASIFGVRTTALIGTALLLASYVGAIAATVYVPGAFNKNFMVAAHACLAMALVYQTRLLQSAEYSRDAMVTFYRSIWNLFYTQYALLPFI